MKSDLELVFSKVLSKCRLIIKTKFRFLIEYPLQFYYFLLTPNVLTIHCMKQYYPDKIDYYLGQKKHTV